MADQQLKLNPYQSQVPLVQIPQQDLQPGGPLPVQAGYMGKAGSAASIGDQILKGFLRGRNVAEQKKQQQAGYAIDLSQRNETEKWQTYQDALRTGQAKPGDETNQAYKDYLQAHDATSRTMEKVAIPKDKPKGQNGQKKKADDDNQPKSFGQKLKDFMEANPHFIPQLAITSRVPNKPVMTADTEQAKNTLTSQGQQIELQGQAIEQGKLKQQQDQLKIQDQKLLQQVDTLGGIDKVAADKNAPPELQAAARRAVSERLDKEGPDGQLRDKLASDVQTGNSKNWTPAMQQMAARLGYAEEPKEVEIERGGKKYLQLVSPSTGQPIQGSKPFYIGPSAASNQMASFFTERKVMRDDLRRAVQEDPTTFGWTPTGDKATDDARINAATDRIFISKEEGIKATAGLTERSGFEVSRDNNILTGVVNNLRKEIGTKATDTGKFTWSDGNEVDLNNQDAATILGQFITNPKETQDIYKFRDKAKSIHGGEDAAKATERDRQWLYERVLNHMMAGKGKAAMTRAEAESYLKQAAPALTRPITADEVKSAPAEPKKKGLFERVWDYGIGKDDSGQQSSKGFGPPPTSSGATPGGKYYMAPGMDGPVQLSDEEVQKAKAANIPLEEVSPDLLKQFSQ